MFSIFKKKNNKASPPSVRKRSKTTAVSSDSKEQAKAQMMANMRAAKAELGEDTIREITEKLRQYEKDKQGSEEYKRARRQIDAMDGRDVARGVRAFLDEN